jgi:hypothetical protein
MSIRVYVNSDQKRAETTALLDSGATENFITPDYAYAMRLPLKRLATPRDVYNVDHTRNWQGQITHYTDLAMKTGNRQIMMRFFLTNLGENKVILGYPWFAAMQLCIDWARGWIEYDQLPVMLTVPTEEPRDLRMPLTPTIGRTQMADD